MHTSIRTVSLSILTYDIFASWSYFNLSSTYVPSSFYVRTCTCTCLLQQLLSSVIQSYTSLITTLYQMLRLAVHGIWTLLLLVQPSTNSAYCSLETVVAERPNCPKFVTIKMSDAKLSLGDEMIHLYTLLAAACHLGRTAVLPDTFRIVSSETSDFHYIGKHSIDSCLVYLSFF